MTALGCEASLLRGRGHLDVGQDDHKHFGGSCGTVRGYAAATTPQSRKRSLESSLPSGAQSVLGSRQKVCQSMQGRSRAGLHVCCVPVDRVLPRRSPYVLLHTIKHMYSCYLAFEEQLRSRLRRQHPVKTGLERNSPEPAPTIPGIGPCTIARAYGDSKKRKTVTHERIGRLLRGSQAVIIMPSVGHFVGGAHTNGPDYR